MDMAVGAKQAGLSDITAWSIGAFQHNLLEAFQWMSPEIENIHWKAAGYKQGLHKSISEQTTASALKQCAALMTGTGKLQPIILCGPLNYLIWPTN